MLRGEESDLIIVVLTLCPQLAEACLLTFRHSGLRHRTAEDELAGTVQPVPGERVHDLMPNTLF